MIRRNFYEVCDTFLIDGIIYYPCPKILDGIIPLEKYREDHLRNDVSPMNTAWEKFIESSRGNYKNNELGMIREFPLPIANKTRYRELAKKVGGENKEFINEVWNHHHFFLDYFFYNLGLGIELDSDYHKGRELRDILRDLYIGEEYGIKILRTYRYGIRKKVEDNKFNNKFKKEVSNLVAAKTKQGKLINAPFIVDFGKSINKLYFPLETGKKYLSDISEKIYQEISFNFLSSEEVIVPKDWFKSNYPDLELTRKWLELLEDFYYEQYSKKLKFT